MEHKVRNPPPPKPPDPKKRKRFGGSRSKKQAFVPKALPKDNDQRLASIDPLINSVRNQRYLAFKFLYVWGIIIPPAVLRSLGALIARGQYPLKLIDLSDCLIQPDASLDYFGRCAV